MGQSGRQEEFLAILQFRLDREDADQLWAVYPTRDLPLDENKDQYVWDLGMVQREDGHVSMNGGILYSQRNNDWSSHT